VDDDRSVLRMLEFGLKKLGSEYRIHTASDMSNAIEQIEKQWFDLVITDYMMPGMTGVDLATVVRSISPDTQVVLMTAYGTNKLRNTTHNLRFDGYLNKPFTMDQIREMVRQTANRSMMAGNESEPALEHITSQLGETPFQDKPFETMNVGDHLQKLHINAGARAVVLINAKGNAVKVVGQLSQAKIGRICTQIASNYHNAADLSKLLDNSDRFKASFFEGDDFNLYVCDVNKKFLLAVVFDVKLRPGGVWFYTRQTAVALASLLE
jgi:CheY-like chemotaxis protein/predicted regulator of Ras-like GTPase activity (Roadblock/LC7/MglB family)